ncbi:hypothetical protein [Kribbella sp. NPDC051770]|uniref:hypothetical protein n=1 Tax=Kribbella sp. NPDC051770 TaxID=3155413 RepID=UPI003436995A
MISVAHFCRQTSIWRDVAPMLELVVRWLNTQVVNVGFPVAEISRPSRRALISETAFLLAANGYESIPTALAEEFERDARRFLSQLPRGDASAQRLESVEWREVAGLLANIDRWTAQLSSPQFQPEIPGCGVVDAAVADIRTLTTLIEVKAVNRQFRAMDMRQVLTYCALLHASERAPSHVSLLNPRLGRVVTVELAVVAAGASGLGAIELLEDLVQRMTGLQVSA